MYHNKLYQVVDRSLSGLSWALMQHYTLSIKCNALSRWNEVVKAFKVIRRSSIEESYRNVLDSLYRVIAGSRLGLSAPTTSFPFSVQHSRLQPPYAWTSTQRVCTKRTSASDDRSVSRVFSEWRRANRGEDVLNARVGGETLPTATINGVYRAPRRDMIISRRCFPAVAIKTRTRQTLVSWHRRQRRPRRRDDDNG